MEESFGEEFFDNTITHTIDIHRVTGSEVNHSFDLSRIAIGIETIMESFNFS